MAGDVKFIRKNGRIIPIRMNKTTTERIKGAAIIGAGVVTAVAGGALYKKAVVASAKAAFKGFNALDAHLIKKVPVSAQMSFFDQAPKLSKYQKLAHDSFRKSSVLLGFSKNVKKFSPFVGESLIALGSFKIIKTLDKRTKKKINPDLVYGGAAATTLVGSKALDLARNSFDAGMHGRQGVFELGKSAASKVDLSKVKGLFAKALKARF